MEKLIIAIVAILAIGSLSNKIYALEEKVKKLEKCTCLNVEESKYLPNEVIIKPL